MQSSVTSSHLPSVTSVIGFAWSAAAAFAIGAFVRRLSNVTAPGLHVELIPALFFFCLAYFVIGRLLFYFALVIRGKLEQDERLLILRYECIGYGATVIAPGSWWAR